MIRIIKTGLEELTYFFRTIYFHYLNIFTHMLCVEYNKSLDSSHKQEQHRSSITLLYSKRVTVPLSVLVHHDAQRRSCRAAMHPNLRAQVCTCVELCK